MIYWGKRQDGMASLAQIKSEWFQQRKRGLYILALFGYVLFLMEGMSTGLGVYRNPTACWVASFCAVIALACASKAQRWFSLIVLMISIYGAFYGYYRNAQWRVRLDRIQTQQLSSQRAGTDAKK